MVQWVVSDGDVVGAAGDVVVSPLDHQDVLPLVLQLVADVVHPVTQMLDQDLLTGHLGAVHPDQKHVPPWGGRGVKAQRRDMHKRIQQEKTSSQGEQSYVLLLQEKGQRDWVCTRSGPSMCTCFAAVHTEAVLLSDVGLGEPDALGHHLGGVRFRGDPLLGATDGAGHGVHHHGGGLMHAVTGHQLGTWSMGVGEGRRQEEWRAQTSLLGSSPR